MLRLPFSRRAYPCSWDGCHARPLRNETLCLDHWFIRMVTITARNIRRLCVDCGKHELLLTLDEGQEGRCGLCQFAALMEGVSL